MAQRPKKIQRAHDKVKKMLFECDFFSFLANVRLQRRRHRRVLAGSVISRYSYSWRAQNRKSESCAEPVENTAVEPRRALINNLLIYGGLSLKHRLQATEGCRRQADKTHPGGPLSAGRLPTEAIQERTEESKNKIAGKKEEEKLYTRTPLFFPSIYKPFFFYCLNKLQAVFLHQDIRRLFI